MFLLWELKQQMNTIMRIETPIQWKFETITIEYDHEIWNDNSIWELKWQFNMRIEITIQWKIETNQ